MIVLLQKNFDLSIIVTTHSPYFVDALDLFSHKYEINTVAKASQGLADYVIKNFAPEKRKIAVSFDSRIKSDVFAKVAAGVYCQLDDVVTNTVGMLVGWGIWKMLSSVGIAKNPLF